jgi:hypothetical protein
MATQTVATVPDRPTARASITARTLRTDRWWMDPLITFVVFGAFVAYATWAAFDHAMVFGNGAPHRWFYSKPYLSPFYSPCFTDGCPTDISWGAVDIWHWLSPALYVLIFPLSFRATCYYYRRAYYRAYWLSPPACAVTEPHAKYTGETRFPLVIQNIHRYTWYFALIFAGVLTYDAVLGFIYTDHGYHFFVGVGSFVLLLNAILIWGYTLGCHSCRHITAGRLNHFSKHPFRYRWWTFVSKLNHWHRQWAWASLIWIALVDVYIRLVSNGTITDYHHVFGAVH